MAAAPSRSRADAAHRKSSGPGSEAEASLPATEAPRAEARAGHAGPGHPRPVEGDQLITKVGPERTCAGCGKKSHPAEMIHVLLGPEGASGLFEIAVDASGKGSHGGRGAHVHPTPACVAAAAQRGLARSMKRGLAIDGQKLDAAGLSNAIVLSCERRIEGLLSSARRARRIALGADSVVAAGRAGEAHLVMVATDAASAAELGEVRRAIAEGRAIAWGDKARLSLAAGGAERTMGLGVVAITDDRIARAVREAAQTADALRGGATAGRAAAERRSQGADRRSGGAPSKEPSERAAHTDESDRAAIASDERSGRSGRVGEQRSEATDAGGIEPSSTADVGGQAVE